MGWRIRKSIPVARGVRLNLSRGGVSASAGVPGTGVYYTTEKSRGGYAEGRPRSSRFAILILLIAAGVGCFFWYAEKVSPRRPAPAAVVVPPPTLSR